LLLLSPEPKASFREDAETIRESARHAMDLVSQLTALSQSTPPRPEPLCPHEVLRSLGALVRRLLGGRFVVITHVDPGLPSLLTDRNQLERALLNLVINARDAMPNGGEIELTARVIDAESPQHMGARDVLFSVRDHGSGICDDVRDRIFEPFVSSKGRGSGLGLTSVRAFVEQYGGQITFDTRAGEGTTFCLRLPGVNVVASAPPPSSRSMERGEGQTVLLVEPDPALGEATRRLLETNGYRVLWACGGGEAMLAAERCARSIEIVIVTPELAWISSEELVERLAETRPNLRALLIQDSLSAPSLNGTLVVAHLRKPFDPDTLLSKLQQLSRKPAQRYPSGVKPVRVYALPEDATDTANTA
jgi:CheY-like chemotaxis protein